MSAELFVFGAEDEHGPHRCCTGHVTGSDKLVTCPLRATRVIWEEPYGGSFACDDPRHIGNAKHIDPIGEFFHNIRVTILADEAAHALAACVEPE